MGSIGKKYKKSLGTLPIRSQIEGKKGSLKVTLKAGKKAGEKTLQYVIERSRKNIFQQGGRRAFWGKIANPHSMRENRSGRGTFETQKYKTWAEGRVGNAFPVKGTKGEGSEKTVKKRGIGPGERKKRKRWCQRGEDVEKRE